MTDYEWRAAELMLKLAIATEALQQKHEENLELIQERNKWQAIAENALEAASPLNPRRGRPMLTAKEIEEWYEDEVNAQIVRGSVKLSSANDNAQAGARNGCRGSLSPNADQLGFVGRNRPERRVF
jgi:3-methyladenine DNA glycosylase Tag